MLVETFARLGLYARRASVSAQASILRFATELASISALTQTIVVLAGPFVRAAQAASMQSVHAMGVELNVHGLVTVLIVMTRHYNQYRHKPMHIELHSHCMNTLH